MIKVSFGGSDSRLTAALRAKSAKIEESLEVTLDQLMLALQRRVQQKLSGEVLQHRSGKALASVNKEPTVRDGSQIVGRVTGGAGPAFYLRIQEAGGTRTYDILPKYKKALAFFPGGSLGGGGGFVPLRHDILRSLYKRSGADRGSLKPSQYGAAASLGGIVVKKVVHPPLPARPSFRPSLIEMQSEIVEKLRKAALNALRGQA